MSAILTRIGALASGQGLAQRAFRGSALTVLGFGSMQAIRLGSNLILTRLLFPEVFGLMALIMVIIQGLNNFSDVGITPAIMQSKRGDDQSYLNTAFTMQVMRGIGLWIACCIFAYPAARFYEIPELVWYLPIAGLTTIIHGLQTTRVESANRHLQMGRLTLVEVLAALFSVIVTIALSAVMRSAWALVIGLVLGAIIRVLLAARMLPGTPNRLHWDRSAVTELVSFGKWIFPSTVVGFALSQGDKAILGKYLTLGELGIYNIAFFFASFPVLLGQAVITKVMIPVYRDAAGAEAENRFRQLRKVRAGLTAGFLLLTFFMAAIGPALVQLLYDARYDNAGPMVTMIACATIPALIGLTYDQAALASGNSRGYFWLTLVRAALFLTFFLVGVRQAGIAGGLAGQALATIAAYPLIVRLARRHKVWDPLHDLLFGAIGAGLAAVLLL
ncbi:oligosaccharide flippase family protein [Paracoccus zeaxanthinifaciens]|uniref:oligosaccharide flippase family protein n=1 Tax=Paracoccus zeaxanthinifaciens TaxID=187400 RepID=UPI0003B74177|nr:oligosaccharide flippase family protein [Paracoccus zeaxanthinifaciens]